MEVTLPVTDVSKKLFLARHVATGDYDELPVSVTLATSTGNILVQIGEKQYMITIEQLITQVAKLAPKE